MINALQFRRLTDSQCKKLLWASMEILERTGIRLHYQPAIDLLKKAGAFVSEGNRVRIPPSMIENALTTAPNEFTLHNRLGEPAIVVGGYRNSYGTGSDCPNILDHRTDKRRKAVLNDIKEGVILCDALPNINFVMSMFLPSDVPTMIADRYEMECMLNYTSKPIIFVTTDLAGCKDAIKMAEIVYGGSKTLQQNPYVACYINVTNGLQHNKEALQKLLYLSSKNIPATYIPVALGGATAPITLAGNMAIWNAGCLVGLAISQLNNPGSPFITSGWGASALDMRTMVSPYVEPEKQFIAQELAHFNNLPMFAFGGMSDSKLADQQAGIEASLTLMSNILSGSNLIHDLGYLESGLTGSFAQLVICDEIISWIETALSPIEITEDTLALDLIDKIGPDGQFIDSDHTLTYFRTRWYPDIIERSNYERWLDKGGYDMGQRAVSKVDLILKDNKPELLPVDIRKKLRKIVKNAEESDHPPT
jgi:trimethylamine--corrinoid protein Co-methyltransferase